MACNNKKTFCAVWLPLLLLVLLSIVPAFGETTYQAQQRQREQAQQRQQLLNKQNLLRQQEYRRQQQRMQQRQQMLDRQEDEVQLRQREQRARQIQAQYETQQRQLAHSQEQRQIELRRQAHRRNQQEAEQRRRELEKARMWTCASSNPASTSNLDTKNRVITPAEAKHGFTGRVSANRRALVNYRGQTISVPVSCITGLNIKAPAAIPSVAPGR